MGSRVSHQSGLLALCLAGLAACGGDSSDSGGTTSQNRAPTVDAGAAQTVDEFAAVTLAGTASDADGDALTYLWDQTDGLGVTINNATSLTASFNAPDVLATSTPEILTFRLTVNDGTTTRSDTVSITVNDVGLGTNSPPTADAGGDLSVLELTVVDLDGTASADADGDMLTYSWTQTGGPGVALSGADTATPSFTAPDVGPGASVALTFELTVDDGADTATDSVIVSVSETLSVVSVAGRLTYERPGFNLRCRGLDFSNITLEPVRRATVLLLDAAGNELAAGQTDDNGNYSFPGINANTDVRVRVRAELLQTSGQQTWEVYVRDNTVDTGPSYETRPVYAIEWGLFNTGGTNSVDNDFTATTDLTDYREVEGMWHPFLVTVKVSGLAEATGVDDAEMARLRAQVDEMKKQMEQMPEAQRKMMEQMMEQRMSGFEEMLQGAGDGTMTIEVRVKELRVNSGPLGGA